MTDLDKKLASLFEEAFWLGHEDCTEDYCENDLYGETLDNFVAKAKQLVLEADHE